MLRLRFAQLPNKQWLWMKVFLLSWRSSYCQKSNHQILPRSNLQNTFFTTTKFRRFRSLLLLKSNFFHIANVLSHLISPEDETRQMRSVWLTISRCHSHEAKSISNSIVEMPLATKTYSKCQVHHASVSQGQNAKFKMLLQLPGSGLWDASLYALKINSLYYHSYSWDFDLNSQF